MEVTFHRPRCLLPAPSGSRTGRVGRVGVGGGERLGVVSGMSASPKTRREDDKRITVDIFPTDTCVMLPPAATFADRRMSRKITVVCLPFSVALLFCSPASPHSCFLYYFISVSAPLSLPPPRSISLFLFCITPSLPPSVLLSRPLPLLIFACATFNCGDMPCGKLCLCVLERALLVMAVFPDARGGVQIPLAEPCTSADWGIIFRHVFGTIHQCSRRNIYDNYPIISSQIFL